MFGIDLKFKYLKFFFFVIKLISFFIFFFKEIDKEPISLINIFFFDFLEMISILSKEILSFPLRGNVFFLFTKFFDTFLYLKLHTLV